MLAAALQAEVAGYVERFADLRDENGRRLVVRNGSAEPRTVLTSAWAVKAFAAVYGAKFPKATTKITEDEEELLAFCDYPAQRWIHLRTTNPVQSTFATVRLRTKGHGSPAAALGMVERPGQHRAAGTRMGAAA
jgi:Transposase, Mutator family